MSTKPEPGVAAVNRAMSILKAFEDSVEGMSLTDLMNATGLYHSTILRLCESLEHANLLKRLDDGRYRLGPYALYLGMLYQGAFRLQDYAAPVLRELVKATEETGAIYIREGDDRICLHRMVHPRTVRMHVREGERVQLELGAAGKVLLAFGGGDAPGYDAIRRKGYAISLGERDPESAAIACPVFDIKQDIVCAVSLGVPRYRFDQAAFDRCLPAVMQAATTLTRDLGGDATLMQPPHTGSRVPAPRR